MESRENYVNPADFVRILEEIPRLNLRKWKNNDVVMLFKILYWFALRPMEGIVLTKEDFNIKDGLLRLRHTKTSKLTFLRFPPPIRAELQEYIPTKQEGRLYPGLTYITFYKWTEKLGKRLGIVAWTSRQEDTGEKTKGHIFRKSLGKALVYGEHDDYRPTPEAISLLLRHDDPLTTFKYYLKESQFRIVDQWEEHSKRNS